jgi:hypothetical protein
LENLPEREPSNILIALFNMIALARGIKYPRS